MSKYARGARAPVSRLITQKKARDFFSSISMRTSFIIMPLYKNIHANFTTDKLTLRIIVTNQLGTNTSNLGQPLISIHLTLLYLKSKLVKMSGCPKSINQGSLTSTIKPYGYMTIIGQDSHSLPFT